MRIRICQSGSPIFSFAETSDQSQDSSRVGIIVLRFALRSHVLECITEDHTGRRGLDVKSNEEWTPWRNPIIMTTTTTPPPPPQQEEESNTSNNILDYYSCLQSPGAYDENLTANEIQHCKSCWFSPIIWDLMLKIIARRRMCEKDDG